MNPERTQEIRGLIEELRKAEKDPQAVSRRLLVNTRYALLDLLDQVESLLLLAQQQDVQGLSPTNDSALD